MLPILYRKFTMRLRFAFIVATFLFALGCGSGGGGANNSVSGKVTYNGKGVGGTISFVGTDKKVDSPILDGEYKIDNPPMGNVKVAVVGMPDSGAIVPKDPKGGKSTDVTGKAESRGVSPPVKYALPDNGLTYEVKAGKHTHNIDLK